MKYRLFPDYFIIFAANKIALLVREKTKDGTTESRAFYNTKNTLPTNKRQIFYRIKTLMLYTTHKFCNGWQASSCIESRKTRSDSGPILNKRSTTLKLGKKPCFSRKT